MHESKTEMQNVLHVSIIFTCFFMLQFFFFCFFYLLDLKPFKFCILELAIVIIKAGSNEIEKSRLLQLK